MNDRRRDVLALLAAVAMFCSTLEYLIPKPLPFFRVGLANLPILVTLHVLTWKHTLVLILLKVVGQAIINGTLASYVFLFSLFGSFASGLVMLFVHRTLRRRVTLIGVSLAGAVASNAVQLLLSIRFVFGAPSWVMAPPFLILGSVAGIVVGIVAERYRRRSRWLPELAHAYGEAG